MEQVSYGPLIMSINLIMSCCIRFFNVQTSQHGTSVLRLIRRTNLRDLTLHECMWPAFMWIYATWHYTNLRDLTLHEFSGPDFMRIYGTWLYANLCNLTLHEFTWPDITRIHVTWHYTNLCDLTLHEFTWPDITRILLFVRNYPQPTLELYLYFLSIKLYIWVSL